MEPGSPTTARFLIIGPGALGSLLATSLFQRGFRVALFDHNCERAAYLNGRGLTLFRGKMKTGAAVPVFCRVEEIPAPEVIFLCVKSTGVSGALDDIRSLLHEDNLLITLQNGMSHLEIIEKQFPTLSWAAGVTAMGANLRSANEVVFAGSGKSRFGFLKKAPAKQMRLLLCAVDVLNQCGFESEFEEYIEKRIWEKLLINVGINALTAIHGCPNGDLLLDEKRLQTLTAAIQEAAAVAKAKGIELKSDPVEQTIGVCRSTAANISSMLQDVRRQRKTEIDAINGAIVRFARDLSIEVPVNSQLTDQVKQIESNFG